MVQLRCFSQCVFARIWIQLVWKIYKSAESSVPTAAHALPAEAASKLMSHCEITPIDSKMFARGKQGRDELMHLG